MAAKGIARFTSRDLALLTAPSEGPCISIYAPMVEAGPETRQNRVRFKNLLQRAAELLRERYEVKGEERSELLEPLRGWLGQNEVWQRQGRGLAAYRSAGYTGAFQLAHRVDELVAVQERFHVGPLLPLLTGDGRYFVLALSQKDVRLFEGTRDGLIELELGETPRSLTEAVGGETEEPHLQYHTSSTRRGGGEGGPVYHGQGGGEDDALAELEVFLERVSSGVEERTDSDGPLVLACVESIAAHYRKVVGDDRIVDDFIPGNPDRASAEELHEKAWEIVEPLFRREREAALERFAERHGTGLATARLAEVLPAAIDGRVDTLFVARGVRRWGRWNDESREVEPADETEPGALDLKEEAAVSTLRRGGTVFSIRPETMPVDGAVTAAILRY